MIPLLAAPDQRVVTLMRINAAKMVCDGRQTPAAARHVRRCTEYHAPTQAILLYTRDAGMHSSGWFKNPDYDRCFHLSISFAVPLRDGRWQRLPFNRKMGTRWAEAFFGDNCRLLWIEGPFSTEGKECDTHHYRLFCDPAWQPILPKGEVYSRDWTPADWKSWSDLHGTPIETGANG